MRTSETSEAKRPPQERLLLREEDPAERRYSEVFVEVPGGSGPDCKEIGELSRAEMRALEPGLRIRVINRLLECYVARLDYNVL
jgi:hypothetical protein